MANGVVFQDRFYCYMVKAKVVLIRVGGGTSF